MEVSDGDGSILEEYYGLHQSFNEHVSRYFTENLWNHYNSTLLLFMTLRSRISSFQSLIVQGEKMLEEGKMFLASVLHTV